MNQLYLFILAWEEAGLSECDFCSPVQLFYARDIKKQASPKVLVSGGLVAGIFVRIYPIIFFLHKET